MLKYVSLFLLQSFYLELELGSKDFISISTLTLVRVKEKEGGGAVVRLPCDGLVVSQHRQTERIVMTDAYG